MATMDTRLFLSHETALAYWRLKRQSVPALGSNTLPSASRITSAPQTAYTRTEVDHALRYHPIEFALHHGEDKRNDQLERRQVISLFSLSELTGKPVHVCVFDARQRGNSRLLTVHSLCKELAPGSFCLDRSSGNPARGEANGILVASPALCFVQMASILDIPSLIDLGKEMCGTYSLSPIENEPPAYNLTPLTTAERILSYIEHIPTGARISASGAKIAARYLLNMSASAMESAVSTALTLPYRLGGYGLPAPLLNAWVNSDGELVSPLHGTGRRPRKESALETPSGCSFEWKDLVKPDLLWPDHRVVVEYQSAEFHATRQNFDNDRRRIERLERMGFSVYELTPDIVADDERFDRIARSIASKVGHRIRPRWKTEFASPSNELHAPAKPNERCEESERAFSAKRRALLHVILSHASQSSRASSGPAPSGSAHK